MNTLEAIKNRKSTRTYKPDMISEKALEIILQAGMAAPVSNARYDSLHLTVVQNEEILKDIFGMATELVHGMGMEMNMDFGARTLIIVSAVADTGGNTNAGFVVGNMVLAATDLGIDSVVMGIIPVVIRENGEILKKLGIPEGFSPVMSAVFGYGANEENAKEHYISVNRV